jgi:hypothetical protein
MFDISTRDPRCHRVGAGSARGDIGTYLYTGSPNKLASDRDVPIEMEGREKTRFKASLARDGVLAAWR